MVIILPSSFLFQNMKNALSARIKFFKFDYFELNYDKKS